jgi:hypothetical protein
MLSDEVLFLLAVHARQVYRALALYIADHLRHGVFRRYRDQHVHMIAQQMTLFDPDLSLLSQPAKDLSQMLS